MARKVTADEIQYMTYCDEGDTVAGRTVFCVGKFENKI